MIHSMTLNEKFFLDTLKQDKLIEFRLNDEKRKLIKKNDIIQFKNSSNTDMCIYVKVIKLVHNDTFEHLFNTIDSKLIKYPLPILLTSLNKIYSTDNIKKFGVLAIYFEVI